MSMTAGVSGRRIERSLRWPSGLAVIALFAASPGLRGASHTWSGAASGSWSNAGNWSVGGAPANGESVDLVFPAAQGNMGAMNNDRIGLTVASMAFADTAYALGGNGLTLAGTVLVTGGIPNGSVNINVDVKLAADSTFTSTNDLVTGKTYFLAFSGTIGGASGVHIASAPGHAGEVVFTHANNYAGTTWVDSGYLLIDDPGGLGSTAGGTVVASGATLSLNRAQAAPWTIAGESLTIGGGGANGNAALQISRTTWTGPVMLTADVTIRTDGVAVLGGLVSGSFGMALRASQSGGIGELDLTQDNSYSQPTSIEYGTLVVTGIQPASDISLHGYTLPPSTLRGTGTVGNVSMGDGAFQQKIVAPGTEAAPGILHTGNLSLADVSSGNLGVLSVRLNGTTAGSTYDQVAVTGTVDVTNATLQVSPGFAPVVGDSFVIVSNDGSDPVTGAFRVGGVPLSEGGLFTAGGAKFRISYAGNGKQDVVLTVVPANATAYYSLPLCRVLDTRNGAPAVDAGAPGMSAMEERTLDATVMTRCNIPAGAKAVALNVTAVSATTSGYISLYPGGVAWPGTSTVSSSTMKTRASATIATLGAAGGLTLKNGSGGTIDVVIDVSGYFQ